MTRRWLDHRSCVDLLLSNNGRNPTENFIGKFSVGEIVKVSGVSSGKIVEKFDHKCGVNSSIGESIHLSRYGGGQFR